MRRRGAAIWRASIDVFCRLILNNSPENFRDFSARGIKSYEAMRDEVRRKYGPPTNIGASDPPILTWDWTDREPRAQLSFNANTDQALFTLRARSH